MYAHLERLVDPESGRLEFYFWHVDHLTKEPDSLRILRFPTHSEDYSVQFECSHCRGRWVLRLEYRRDPQRSGPVMLSDDVNDWTPPLPVVPSYKTIYHLHDRTRGDKIVSTVNAD